MLRVDWPTGLLRPAAEVLGSVKTLGQLEGVFGDASAWSEMDPTNVVYRVQAWCPIPDGTEGGLFGKYSASARSGRCRILHDARAFSSEARSRGYYATVAGEGALILMDEARKTWMEPMSPGSLHFIPPRIAHRVANVGDAPLHFVACWPSDAGHDYDSIRKYGFGARLLKVGEMVKLVESDP